jgi:hypothetical protein
MATPKKESREEKLFRKYSFKIKDAILHPKEIANELYSNDIIDTRTRNKIHKSNDGANELIIAVEAYIRSLKLGKKLEARFTKILDIFHEHTPLNVIVSQMKDEYSGKVVVEYDNSQNDQLFTRKKTEKSPQNGYTKTENVKTKNGI